MTVSLPSIAEPLNAAESVELLASTDGKSGVQMERVLIAGISHVVKYVSFTDDWIMRTTRDLQIRPLQMWEAGLYDQVPLSIDHATIAMGLDDPDDDRSTARLAILMRDVGPYLVPEGDLPVTIDEHATFVSCMAELHAAFWGWRDELGLLSMRDRYLWFSPANLSGESARADCAVPPRLAVEGWDRLATRAGALSEILRGLQADPTPLLDALAATPQTFLHGDWKMGNLGRVADGRLILIDWALPGGGSGCADLAYYIALNRARLPEPKEQTIERYRRSLEQHGVSTDGWWDRQLELSLLGCALQFAWEKALGEGDEAAAELDWWSGHAVRACRLLL